MVKWELTKIKKTNCEGANDLIKENDLTKNWRLISTYQNADKAIIYIMGRYDLINVS